MVTTELDSVQAPEVLRACKGWLVWKSEPNPKAKKPSKVPYYVNGKRRHGTNGSPEDVAQLTDFATAKTALKSGGYTGLGFAFLPEFGVTCVDFDGCNIVDGVIPQEIEKAGVGTYTEYSPSGDIHIWVLGNLGDKKSHAKDGNFGIELFSTKIWVTFTGKPTELTEVTCSTDTLSDPNEDLTMLILSRFGEDEPYIPSFILGKPETLGVELPVLQHALTHYKADTLNYDEWFATGCAIHHETDGAEEGFILWDSWSANSPKYSTEEYGRYKWESMGRNTTIRPITARSLIMRANALGAGIPLPDTSISTDDFTPIIDPIVPATAGDVKSFFNIRTTAEFVTDVRPVSWLIKGFLPQATLGVLYGESGSGKSFIALDICAALTRQLEWNGLRCQKSAGRVLYVVAEGVGGFAVRLAAYIHQAGISKDDLAIDIISDVAPNLTDGISVDHLIRDIMVRDPYDLIVMDTFAQVTAGANENSGEDMGRALGYCRKISQSAHAMVLLIHHSGKDSSKGARGWSGVHAACDVVYEVSRADDNRVIRVTKQKDGIDGAEYGFKLLSVYLGEDADGDDITSCVVEYGPVVKVVKVPELKTNERLVNSVLLEYSPEAWTTVNNVVELCIERMPKEEDGRDTRKQTVKRTINNGINKFIECNDNGEIRAKRM